MKHSLSIALSCIAITLCVSQQRPGDAGSVVPIGYELYSWQEPNGGWSFCVLPSPSGVNVSAEEVFNKRFFLRGVTELKRKISVLPVGATIFWPDRIVDVNQKAKQTEKLSYPPPEMIRDIRRQAETRKIRVEVLSSSQNLK